MTVIEFHIKESCLPLFPFLKEYPTRTYKKGEYFKLVYLKPEDCFLTGFILKGVRVVVQEKPALAGWLLRKDIKPIFAEGELLETIELLESEYLRKHRQGYYIQLKGHFLDLVSHGIRSNYDMQFFVKTLFIHGYEWEEMIGLYSFLIRNTNLNKKFIRLSASLYKTGKENYEYN